jgi:folate-dependent phosphoribosylglycinamide formyltransferase PurN
LKQHCFRAEKFLEYTVTIVFISSCDPFAAYIIEQVRRVWSVARVIRPVYGTTSRRESRWAKLCRAPVDTVIGKFRRAFYGELERRQARFASRALFGQSAAPAVADREDVPARQINGPETAERLAALGPDLVLVSGAPILKPEIFDIPRLGTINVHFGIAPQYRGEHTLFWPLYLQDYEHIGVTIHRIDSRVDTGTMLARGFPELDERDSEATLLVKSTRLAARLLLELLGRADDAIGAGRTQEAVGRQFLRRDRKPWMDICVAARRWLLGRRPPRRAERLERFYDSPPVLLDASLLDDRSCDAILPAHIR